MNDDTTPFLTWTIISLNIAAFIAAFFVYRPENAFSVFAFRPALFLQGEWYRLVTAGFLHNGLPHLFWNMVFLYLFGRVAESIYGLLQAAAIYLGGMMVGNLSVLLLPVSSQVVGASGAVFGLIGATILLEPMRPVVKNVPIPISLIGASYILPSVFNAFNVESDIAHIAHLSGAVAGAVVAFMEDREKAWKGVIAVAAFTALILGLALF